jgi:transposase
MLKLNEETQIYVADKPVDCRKAINGLASLVLEQFEKPVNDGSVYVFYNNACDRIKCLFWDKNGFVLYHKRLERGRFKMGKGAHDAAYVISQNQLDWLLAGLDFQLMHEFKALDFTHYF